MQCLIPEQESADGDVSGRAADSLCLCRALLRVPAVDVRVRTALCVSAGPQWLLRLGYAAALWELFTLLDIDSQALRDLPLCF